MARVNEVFQLVSWIVTGIYSLVEKNDKRKGKKGTVKQTPLLLLLSFSTIFLLPAKVKIHHQQQLQQSSPLFEKDILHTLNQKKNLKLDFLRKIWLNTPQTPNVQNNAHGSFV